MRVDGTIYPFSDAAPLLMGAAVFGCRCEWPDAMPCYSTHLAAAVHSVRHDGHACCGWAPRVREWYIVYSQAQAIELSLWPTLTQVGPLASCACNQLGHTLWGSAWRPWLRPGARQCEVCLEEGEG